MGAVFPQLYGKVTLEPELGVTPLEFTLNSRLGIGRCAPVLAQNNKQLHISLGLCSLWAVVQDQSQRDVFLLV